MTVAAAPTMSLFIAFTLNQSSVESIREASGPPDVLITQPTLRRPILRKFTAAPGRQRLPRRYLFCTAIIRLAHTAPFRSITRTGQPVGPEAIAGPHTASSYRGGGTGGGANLANGDSEATCVEEDAGALLADSPPERTRPRPDEQPTERQRAKMASRQVRRRMWGRLR